MYLAILRVITLRRTSSVVLVGLDNFQNHVVTAVGAFGVGGNVVLSAAVLDAFCFYVFGNKLSHTGRDTCVKVFQAPTTFRRQIVEAVARSVLTFVHKTVVHNVK